MYPYLWFETCTCICSDERHVCVFVVIYMTCACTCCDVRHVHTCICCDMRHVPAFAVNVMRGMYLYLMWDYIYIYIPVLVMWDMYLHLLYLYLLWCETCTCTCDERHVPVFVVRHVPVLWWEDVPVFVVMRGMYLYLLWWELPCFFAEWRKEGVRAVVGYCTPGVGLGGNVTNTSSRIHLPCQACGILHCGARMQWQEWAVLVSVLILLPVIDGLQGED